MFIQRKLRTAVLAELLLFLMVANCAPSRPREDAGRVPGNPASSYLPSVVSSSSSNIIKSGHKRKEPASLSLSLKDHPPNEIAGFRRVYRWSTGCSSVRPGGGLLRFLLKGVDARGGSTDPDTDIELSSVGSEGKVYIISKTRKHYLCFNKKGQLVTKKRLGGDKTLCQFYETLWRGNRRFVSVYRRHQQQQQQPVVPWPVPLPGSPDRSSWKDGSPLSPVAPAFQLDNQDHPDDWHVGFDLSGKPLKGSAWRNSIYRSCFDLVEHVDHVHSSGVRPSPVGDNQMEIIFQSENSVPERAAETGSGKSRKLPASNNSPATPSKNNNNKNPHGKSQAKNKVNGGSGGSVNKNSSGRTAPVNHKNGAAPPSNSWKSPGSNSGAAASSNKRNNHKISQQHSSATSSGGRNREGVLSEEQVRARKPKSEKAKATKETELMAPVEFWTVDDTDKYNDRETAALAPASANVDFDSYLAETEQLLAHPERVIGHSEDSSASATGAPAVAAFSSSTSSTSSPAQRSAFIHLDSGGWEEVVYSKSGDSTPTAPILHPKDDSVKNDQWQTQMKWKNGEE
ncbi:uncharacterized protein LOC124192334 isoform X2 [Daphnia pulex]|uniref:uncharacterized protein LOC124192334 isoform X2 n=1 Tax=Daphnia pulex TaxID=6669 RepID=UPI001EE13A89|nr:uncharacterized protein LOC124192334 isoform X2 [Daphnia pulex]